MDEPSAGRIILAYAVVFGLAGAMAWFPRTWWARALRSRHGPDLNAAFMTRREAWQSATGFVGIAVMGFFTALLSSWLGDWLYGSFDRSMGFSAVLFMSSIGVMVGIGGAIYMSIRAMFRPATMYSWREDPLAQATFLKKYHSSDGNVKVLVFQHDPRDFEVVVIDPLPSEASVGLTHRAFSDGLLRTVARTVTLEEAERAALEATGHIPFGKA